MFRFLKDIRIKSLQALGGCVIMVWGVCAAGVWGQPAPLVQERFTLVRDGHELKLPYAASHALSEDHEKVEHLAVMVHGVLRNADRYHRFMEVLWRQSGDETLAVLSPQFIAIDEVQEHELDASYPYWASGGWSVGHRSRSDGEHQRSIRISSFEMLDELLREALRRYPNLKRITLAGHSAGGQFINRYAAGNRLEEELSSRGVSVRYIVSNPSSYLYFCENRLICRESREFGPLEQSDCALLNRYRYGLDGEVNAYMQSAGLEQLGNVYASRRITYLLGEADNDPEANRLDRSCAALAQGEHRLERGQIYVEYLSFRFGPEIADRHTLVLIPGVGHNAMRMFSSRAGRQALLGPDDQ